MVWTFSFILLFIPMIIGIGSTVSVSGGMLCSAAQQQPNLWCVTNSFPGTNAKHSTVRAAVGKLLHLSQPQCKALPLIIMVEICNISVLKSATEELGSRGKLNRVTGIYLCSWDKVWLYGFGSREGNSVIWVWKDVVLVPQHDSHKPASMGKKLEQFFFLLAFPNNLSYISVVKDGRAWGRKNWFGPNGWYYLCTQVTCIREEVLLGTSVTSRNNCSGSGSCISLPVQLHLSLAMMGLAL